MTNSSDLTIYLLPPYPRTLIVKGIAQLVDPTIKFSDGKDPVYQANFPLKRFPTLMAADGWKIHELLAIMEYLSTLNPGAYNFFGKTARETAETWQWLSFNNQDLIMSVFEPDVERVGTIADEYEKALSEHKYLVGATPTLADAFGALTWNVAAPYSYAGKVAEWAKTHPHMAAWVRDMIANDPIVRKTTTESAI